MSAYVGVVVVVCFFFQAEDGIRDLVRSRGLGDVYKRQIPSQLPEMGMSPGFPKPNTISAKPIVLLLRSRNCCLLYTSDAADERSSVDLGGRRIIKKQNSVEHCSRSIIYHT